MYGRISLECYCIITSDDGNRHDEMKFPLCQNTEGGGANIADFPTPFKTKFNFFLYPV